MEQPLARDGCVIKKEPSANFQDNGEKAYQRSWRQTLLSDPEHYKEIMVSGTRRGLLPCSDLSHWGVSASGLLQLQLQLQLQLKGRQVQLGLLALEGTSCKL